MKVYPYKIYVIGIEYWYAHPGILHNANGPSAIIWMFSNNRAEYYHLMGKPVDKEEWQIERHKYL